MQTNTNPVGPSRWTKRAWLLPLILAVAACGGGRSSDPTQGLTAEPQQAASVPEELRGQWETVLTYVPPFYSGPFGDTPQGDGSLGIAFYFWPDGRYEHHWNLAQAYFGGNCFRTARWQETGTLSGVGPEPTFNPGRAIFSKMDSCGNNQYLDPAPVAPASHSLTLDRDATGWPLLRMGFPTGELVLEKCRRCQ